MRYSRNLFLSEELENKKEKIIEKLEKNKFQGNLHLLILPDNGKNQLEIIHSALLLQPDYPSEQLFVAGLAKSYDDALELVEKITREVYDRTKDADIRNYILRREQEE